MNTVCYTQKQLIGLLDLTRLNLDDTEAQIVSLCEAATTPHGNVAAVCMYPRWLPTANACLKNTNVALATVSNFPSGMLEETVYSDEIMRALADGAHEIDWVLPYPKLLADDLGACEKALKRVRTLCPSTVKIKVILETGELETDERIALASQMAIDQGVDFLKTSTGKTKVGATLAAAEVMLNIIAKNSTKSPHVGFKAAGGVRTVKDALGYIELAARILGEDFINAKTFRLGASQLLTEIQAHFGN